MALENDAQDPSSVHQQASRIKIHHDPESKTHSDIESKTRYDSESKAHCDSESKLHHTIESEVHRDTNTKTHLDPLEFAHFEKGTCLLCQRRFKDVAVLRRHMAESELHQRNLKDDRIRMAGLERCAMKDKDTSSSAHEGYRDRASERRTVFGVETLGEEKTKHRGGKKRASKKDEGIRLSSPKQVPAESHAQAVQLTEETVGGAMLAKMGWSSGQGLGSLGQGRKDAVPVHHYDQGAGLGSARRVSAEDYANKRTKLLSTSHSEALRERARDRYERE